MRQKELRQLSHQVILLNAHYQSVTLIAVKRSKLKQQYPNFGELT
jgi:hypothetical protein